jgi:hypothetical protein
MKMEDDAYGLYDYFSSRGENYYDPYMTSFVDKSALIDALYNPRYPWELSSYWGRSPYSYPSDLALYTADSTEKPENALDLLHPYYRTRFAKYAVPGIFVAGLGFIAWITYKTYFKDPTGGKWTEQDRRTNIKKFWANVSGGFLGGMAFGTFMLLLVSLQMWLKGLSLPKTIKYFGEQAQVTAGISELER